MLEMKAALAALAALALVLAAVPALAQQGRGRGHEAKPPPSQMSHDERRRLREDVDSARGNYNRRDMRRQDRMAPEERERLRRDVQDASKDMRRR